MNTVKKSGRYKKWVLGLLALLLAGGAVIWYVFTEKFEDTNAVKADFSVQAMDFIKEFGKDLKTANGKYAEKIIVVTGTVSEIKNADTTTNLIMSDTTTGAYIIFAFQEQHLNEAKQVKPGDQVSVKGSCSGGVHSEILETDYISFKRCALNK